jgi:hypothetical protein
MGRYLKSYEDRGDTLIMINSNKHLQSILKKHNIEDELDFFVTLWENSEPASAKSLKKHFVSNVLGVNYKEINLYTKCEWKDMRLPSDDVFSDIYKALLIDNKRSKSIEG